MLLAKEEVTPFTNWSILPPPAAAQLLSPLNYVVALAVPVAERSARFIESSGNPPAANPATVFAVPLIVIAISLRPSFRLQLQWH